ncbi:MAG: ABC transporter permease [Pseudomonadota bacterium]
MTITANDAPPPGVPATTEAAAKLKRWQRLDAFLRIALPTAVIAGLIYLWQDYVTTNNVPHYILPSPARVLDALVEDRAMLLSGLVNTLVITFGALFLAVTLGVAIAIALTQSRLVEYSIFPIAVVLQVTPIVAVFPLINIYVENIYAKLLLCAWIVAFFPILSNTTLGLNSADRNLRDLYKLYGASRWQTLRYLQLPGAMPYFLGGLRIAGGLALIGAVVAEFVAGSAGAGTGLASRLIEAGYRLQIPRLFAALFLISLTGIVIYVTLAFVSSKLLSGWHESAMSKGSR